jgi:uncharacterized protein YjiS (DUF1127 family)
MENIMTHVHHAHASRSQGLPLFGAVRTAIRRFHDRRQMNALLKMDDYMLKDIGVSRSDVQREATKSLWR